MNTFIIKVGSEMWKARKKEEEVTWLWEGKVRRDNILFFCLFESCEFSALMEWSSSNNNIILCAGFPLI